jgi:hypothetical protein
VTRAVPAPRTGLHDDLQGRAGLVGSGLIGTELAGAELAATGLAGSGLDDTETAPLAALTWGPPRSFENEVSRLAGLALADDGALEYAAADDGALDGAAADNSVADNEPPDRLASAERPPGYRPPSHSRRRSRQTASAASSGPAGTQPSVVRGLLVTPWFAAATGFVIAVSLWIYSPHPQIAFPDGAIGQRPCIPDGCSPTARPSSAGSLAIKSGRPIARPHKSGPAKIQTHGQTRATASGLAFGYVVRPDSDGNFWLTVTVTGKHIPRDWRLAFVLAGAHIRSVYGAHWHTAGSDGVIASPLTGDSSQQHGGPWDWGGQGGAHDQPGIFFAVLASGNPVGPTHCRLNGASCTFQKLTIPSQGEHG